MADKATARTWQKKGQGDPALLWNIKFWPPAASETGFLNCAQYWHVADQLKDLARCQEPTRCPTVDIAPIDEFWELKDKHGVLGKINLRVFLITDPDDRSIVVLGVHKKEDEGQLRTAIKTRILRRRRHYLDSRNT